MERKLNAWPQFKTTVDGIDFHFLHAKPDEAEKRPVLPMLLGRKQTAVARRGKINMRSWLIFIDSLLLMHALF